MEFRIEGLYDYRTIQLLVNENQINDLGVHFSPKSLNFLQHRQFFSMLEKLSAGRYQFYLNFTGERSNVICHLLDELRNKLAELDYIDCEVWLEFEDVSTEILDQVQEMIRSNIAKMIKGVYWHYRPGVHKLSELLKAGLSFPTVKQTLKTQGLILNYSDIKSMHEDDTLARFIQNFHAQLYADLKSKHALTHNQFKLGLRSNWGDDYFPSLFELFDFDFISLSIDSAVEVCFRNVDLTKLDQELGHIKQISLF